MLDSRLRQLIGFCGLKGSGKDTSADYLVENYGYAKMSLASPIKDACLSIFGFPEDHLWGASSLRETPDKRYLFTGLDPVTGVPLEEVKLDELRWWLRKDGEYFPRYLSPRLALTTMGTEWGRRLCENIWVYSCLNSVRNLDTSRSAITDVRFMNEIMAVQSAGGLVIRLLRGERKSNHPSELELDNISLDVFDFVIDNRGTKGELFSCLDDIIPSVLTR